MKYVVFKYELYESQGGARDFLFAVETVEEIETKLKEYMTDEKYDDIINILNLDSGEIYGNYHIETIYKTNINEREFVLRKIDEIIEDIKNIENK